MSALPFAVGDSVMIIKRNAAQLQGTYGVVERVTPLSELDPRTIPDFDNPTMHVYDVAIEGYDYLLTYRPDQIRRKSKPSFGAWVKEHS